MSRYENISQKFVQQRQRVHSKAEKATEHAASLIENTQEWETVSAQAQTIVIPQLGKWLDDQHDAIQAPDLSAWKTEQDRTKSLGRKLQFQKAKRTVGGIFNKVTGRK